MQNYKHCTFCHYNNKQTSRNYILKYEKPNFVNCKTTTSKNSQSVIQSVNQSSQSMKFQKTTTNSKKQMQ